MEPTINTHKQIDRPLCGTPRVVENGYSKVELTTSPCMAVDEFGLVHGGFIFGMADYAAMIAVNHPHVVLGSANVKFLKPVGINETVIAEARVEKIEGKKQFVSVEIKRGEISCFKGEFTCFILDKHLLS